MNGRWAGIVRGSWKCVESVPHLAVPPQYLERAMLLGQRQLRGSMLPWPMDGDPCTNETTMERWAVRKRIRQLYRLLLDSRVALERASEQMRDRAMKDMFFILACRRLIMMNLLDRELGTMAVRVDPTPTAGEHFNAYIAANGRPVQPLEGTLLGACRAEEMYLLTEFRDLQFQPGVRDRTRMILTELIREVEEDLRDLRFITQATAGARA